MPTTRRRSDPFVGLPAEAKETIQQLLADYDPHQNVPGGSGLARLFADKSPEEVEKILNTLSSVTGPKVDLDKVDYSKVLVQKNSFWVMQLTTDGFVDSSGALADKFKPGFQPNFQLIIYDESGSFRVVENPPSGLPSSAFLLQCLKRAIADPLPPIRKSIPQLLIISIKLSPHVDALRPFLDSLPAAFSWRLETPEEAAEVATGVHDRNVEGVATGLSAAQTEKTLGNQALARRDRKQAVKHYGEAIECLRDAISQNPTTDDEKTITGLMSVCFANRSAAWMMEGEGVDHKKALKDAEEAIKWNEDYSKAYYRQAKAHQLLGDKALAIDVLRIALKRPSLNEDKGLEDFLKELSTET